MSVADGGPTPRPQEEYCGFCGTKIPPLGRFCPTCGAVRESLRLQAGQQYPPAAGPPWMQRPQPARKSTSWRVVIKTLMAYGMLTFLVQLLLMLAALVYGTTIVLPEIVHHTYALYVIAPLLVMVGHISGDALAAYYMLVVAIIIASAVWLFLTGAKGFHKELTMRGERRRHSAIFDLCGLMFGVLFMNVVVVLITEAVSGEPVSPTEDAELWELLFLLANASVWEELIVRVLLIGVPLLLIDLTRHGLKGKIHRYILGGGFDLGKAEVVLILVSSALFGLAHFDGWGAWKVFPASIAGVAFGYMFMRHGLASAIMLHFGFDYLSMPTEVFAGGDSTGALILLGLAVLAWMGMGAVFFGYYIIRMVEFVTKGKYFEERAPAPVPYPFYYAPQYPPPPPSAPQRMQGDPAQVWGPPQAPSGQGGFFVCPACGYTEASWRDGRFQCLRCGTVV